MILHWLPLTLFVCSFDTPDPDSGLEYYYALYKADVGQQVSSLAALKCIAVMALCVGQQRVRLGVL